MLGLFAVEGLLALSGRVGWFGLSQHGDWTALIGLAAVGVTLVLLGLWFGASLVFRWTFQYNLRSLLLLVVAAAVPCSWLAAEVRIERDQWKAAEAIKAKGRFAWGDPTFLGKLLRDDSLVEIYNVDFLKKPTADDDLAPLRELLQVRNLDLDDTRITDAGLVNLERLTHLSSLGLTNTRVTDAGLGKLRGLNELTQLSLDDTNVTDAGLAHLEGLTNLYYLNLMNTRVTDAGLVHLARLKRLLQLGLSGTKVTREGVAKLQRALPQCEIRGLGKERGTGKERGDRRAY